jgi:uncharacterized NAD-dependent epimerase/dehydratase family protein
MTKNMNTLISILMATTVSTAAFAQSVSTDGSVSVGSGADVSAGTSVGADASTNASGNNNAAVSEQGNSKAAKGNYGQLISGLQTSEVSADVVSGLDANADATIVLMSELQGEAAENASALENALEKQKENISGLRSEIEANADLMAALEAEGYTIDQVVAVNSTNSGEINLVVDDSD